MTLQSALSDDMLRLTDAEELKYWIERALDFGVLLEDVLLETMGSEPNELSAIGADVTW